MNYQESLDYLFSQLPMFSRTGAPAYKPGLDTSIELARFFDDPQKKFKSIHVGGTNGKGSTSHMIASVLQAQGYKTALYTSPHLVDFRERIRINGKMIPEDRVVEFVERWKNSSYKGHPSFFELTMIMAFNWFAEEKVDYAVIEVGMGGRLDSTNIITPLLSVITNISHDHNQFLGNSLQEIAGEKAGIIKRNIPVVIGETQNETCHIFSEKAATMNAPFSFADKNIKAEITPVPNGWEIKWEGKEMISPIGGEYQKKNIITVLAAISELRKNGIEISEDAVKEGLENVLTNTGFAGRWMVISDRPLVIADTGHNIAGMTYNVAQLKEIMGKGEKNNLRIVIGFVADKAIDKILKLLPHEAKYYVTNAQIPRALPALQLLEKFHESGFTAEAFPDVSTAFLAAKKEASEKDVIFIGGSTFIVADFLASKDD